ncbi:YjfB family protein [Oligoflexia bacterium]|nr:YjfB family protein [Oligoflexia bacterium]
MNEDGTISIASISAMQQAEIQSEVGVKLVKGALDHEEDVANILLKGIRSSGHPTGQRLNISA